MKLNLFRKDVPQKFIQYYTLFWNETDPSVQFKVVLDLFKELDLKIVDMAYRPGGNPMVDRRCSISFGLKGTLPNFTLFELRAQHNPELKQFSSDSDH